MIQVALSRNGVPIRLTDERWAHIVAEHEELTDLRQDVLKTVSDAERVLAGAMDELLAVRRLDAATVLVVAYKEVSDVDGFVITAFRTSRLGRLDRRVQKWPPRT